VAIHTQDAITNNRNAARAIHAALKRYFRIVVIRTIDQPSTIDYRESRNSLHMHFQQMTERQVSHVAANYGTLNQQSVNKLQDT
jgi:hypothetical protein